MIYTSPGEKELPLSINALVVVVARILSLESFILTMKLPVCLTVEGFMIFKNRMVIVLVGCIRSPNTV